MRQQAVEVEKPAAAAGDAPAVTTGCRSLLSCVRQRKKGCYVMKILGMILLGIGGAFGIALVGGTVVGMIGVILYKIYRKIRYNISLYN